MKDMLLLPQDVLSIDYLFYNARFKLYWREYMANVETCFCENI